MVRPLAALAERDPLPQIRPFPIGVLTVGGETLEPGDPLRLFVDDDLVHRSPSGRDWVRVTNAGAALAARTDPEGGVRRGRDARGPMTTSSLSLPGRSRRVRVAPLRIPRPDPPPERRPEPEPRPDPPRRPEREKEPARS